MNKNKNQRVESSEEPHIQDNGESDLNQIPLITPIPITPPYSPSQPF